MVVRVGAIIYVIPIDSIQRIVHSARADLMPISAAEGHYVLKLAPDEVLPVKFLRRCGASDRDDERDPLSGSHSTPRRRRKRRSPQGQMNRSTYSWSRAHPATAALFA